MESVDLQMDDIFGDGDDDALFNNHASIPDLPPNEGFTSDQENIAGQNTENDAVLARLRDLSKGAAKKTVTRVQPKLDPARLTGDRGIGTLPKVFKDVKFKGKGHEADDLKKVMRYLEHWTHRLFPKMPFDEVLERIEKLGTKKEVQTYIKRMRMDMPIQPDEPEDVEQTEETGEQKRSQVGEDEEEVLDEIFRDQQASQSNHTFNSISQSNTTMDSINQSDTTSSIQNLTDAESQPKSSTTLTAEQKERMEANKRKAHERRMAKLGITAPGTPSNVSSVPRVEVNTPLTYPNSPSAQLYPGPSQEVTSSTPVGARSQAPVPPSMSFEQLTEDQLMQDLENEEELNNVQQQDTGNNEQQSSAIVSTENPKAPNSLTSDSPIECQPVAMDTEDAGL